MSRDREPEYEVVEYTDQEAETPLAVLLVINGEQKWIPKSLIGEQDEVAMTVEIERWFCKQECLL